MRGRALPRMNERGSVSAEIVIAVPALLLVILLSVQFGLYYHASAVARAAAEEGVRAARTDGGSAAAGEAEATDFLAQAAPNLIEDASVSASRTVDEARVEVRGVTVGVVPGLHLRVHAEAAGRVEYFRAPSP